MIRLALLLGLLTLCLLVFCLVDILLSSSATVRKLPKLAWFLLVLAFPFVGSLAWLAAGRPGTAARHGGYERGAPEVPEYDRPGRAAASAPEDDAEFLRQVRARAEEQRRRHEEQKRAREREEQARAKPPPADEA